MNYLKPLFRWVVGPMSSEGLILFKMAVKKVKKIYGNKFDYLICYNNIEIDNLLDLKIDFFNQKELRKEHKEYDVSWKLFPIRLRKQAHEIVMDSDVLLFDKIDEIDFFLESNCSLVCEGLYRNYGNYESKIPNDLRLNTGVYGMPPGFNFIFDRKSFSQFDEQGLMCSNLIKNNYKLISLSTISIIDDNSNFEKYKLLGSKGIHFVGINGGYDRKGNKNFKKYLSRLL
jgi:hypothetical protein